MKLTQEALQIARKLIVGFRAIADKNIVAVGAAGHRWLHFRWSIGRQIIQFGAAPVHHVELGRTRRGEVDMDAWTLLQPGDDLGVFVGRISCLR